MTFRSHPAAVGDSVYGSLPSQSARGRNLSRAVGVGEQGIAGGKPEPGSASHWLSRMSSTRSGGGLCTFAGQAAVAQVVLPESRPHVSQADSIGGPITIGHAALVCLAHMPRVQSCTDCCTDADSQPHADSDCRAADASTNGAAEPGSDC